MIARRARCRRGTPVARDLPIVNKRGLHARAAARFVQCAERFDAEITVSKDQHHASAAPRSWA